MNGDRQSIDRALEQHNNPSTEQVESAVARVWKALPAEARGASLSAGSLQPNARRRSRRLLWMIPAAAVAMLIAVVVIRQVRTPTETIPVQVAKDLVLADGSRVELRSGAEVKLESVSDGQRIQLNRGSIIVFAEKQGSGHLYVKTKDALVSVVGTVFFVSAEEKGSRVAVFEGEVHVQYGAREASLRPGEQLATNSSMPTINLAEEIPWSPRAVKLLAMLPRGERHATPEPPLPPLPTFQNSRIVKDGGFEAAAVRIEDRPSNNLSPASQQGVACTGRDGAWRAVVSEGLTSFAAPRGRCLTRYTGIQMLLASLHDIPWQRVVGNVPNWRVPGSPYEAGFQIDAKADDLTGVSTNQLRKMLIDLIIQRFQLKFHSELREDDGAELKVAQGASKLREVPASEMTLPTLEQSDREWVIKGKTSMKTLADFISKIPPLRCVVADKTGLDGIYEYTLTLRPALIADLSSGGPAAAVEMEKKARAVAETANPCDTMFNLKGGTVYEFNPTFSRALQQQLGLTLQRNRVSVEYIVVDEVSPPSEN